MREQRNYVRWNIGPKDLADLDPVKARELITTCFTEAQKETLARVKEKLGATAGDEEIRKSVVNILKVTFRELNEDYDHPTKGSLMKLVQSLAEKSQSWGTPQDIIEHHKGQIMQVFAAMK